MKKWEILYSFEEKSGSFEISGTGRAVVEDDFISTKEARSIIATALFIDRSSVEIIRVHPI